MDVVMALGELYREKKRLDLAIAKLEAHQGGDTRELDGPALQRVRKSMSAEERRAVSQRMADYWAARKAVTCSRLKSSTASESAHESQPERGQAIA